MAEVKLIIKTEKRVYSIPVNSLSEIDEFSVWYPNKLELGKMLNNILDLNIINFDKVDIFLSYRYSSNSKVSYLPIKYSSDNYNCDSVKETYAKYYKDDHSRIKTNTSGIRNVGHQVIREYIQGTKEITNNEIDMAINSYFNGAGYKKYRDSYFVLKDANYKVKIDKLKEDEQNIDRTNLSTYAVANPYLSGLKRYAALGEEEHAKVMDTLAGYDMDELNRVTKNNNYGLFDGEGILTKRNDREIEHDEAMQLESITSKRLQELKELLNEYYQSKKGMHR